MNKNDGNVIDINKIINKTAEETAKGIVEELRNKNMIRKEMSYYKRVEILLYSYNALKDAVKQKDEDIKNIELYGLPKKSGSVVVYTTSGGGVSEEERYQQLIEKYKKEKEETKRDINRIDRAISKIKNDKYYNIIHIKFFEECEQEKVTDEYIACKIDKDRSTVTRNRKRLMNKLITILFPESVRDII